MSQHVVPKLCDGSTDGEIIRPAFTEKPDGPHLSYNLPFDKACEKHVRETFRAERVYVLASGSLCKNTEYVQQLQQALGSRVVGLRKGMTPHTLWNEVLEIVDECKKLRADLIVTIGAGSLTDAAKIVTLALANNADSFDTLAKLTTGVMTQPAERVNKPATIPILSIPTSLSGGEYSNLGGGTHPTTHQKHPFIDGACGPSLIILSPELTATTPDAIWLSTGVRAVDHCVEGLCSLTNTTSASDATCEQGLQLLIPGLLRCKRNAGDLEARLQCQLGVVEAVKAVFQHGVPLGASHGIGHQLGPLGVGHGETSCILLPAVCKYNISANSERQALASKILCSDKQVSSVLRERGLVESEADLGDILDAVVRELGLPRTLEDVKVEGEETVQKLAQNSLQDHWCVSNPRPLREQAEVMKILDMVRK